MSTEQTLSNHLLDGLDEMAGTVAVKGQLLKELTAEIRRLRKANEQLTKSLHSTPQDSWIDEDGRRYYRAQENT